MSSNSDINDACNKDCPYCAELEQKLSDAEKTISEQNEELVKAYQDVKNAQKQVDDAVTRAAHYEKRCDEIAASRHSLACEARDLRNLREQLLKIMDYIADRLVEAHGYQPREE